MADSNHQEHGQMDISEQERTFNGFIKFLTNGIIISAVALILLYAING